MEHCRKETVAGAQLLGLSYIQLSMVVLGFGSLGLLSTSGLGSHDGDGSGRFEADLAPLASHQVVEAFALLSGRQRAVSAHLEALGSWFLVLNRFDLEAVIL